MASKNQPAKELSKQSPGPASEMRKDADSASQPDIITKQSTSPSGSLSTTESDAEIDSIAGTEVEEERTFTYFPKLAPEIRRMIWKEACSVTRNVDLWIHGSSDFTGLGTFGENLPGNPHSFSSRCHPPAVLATSKESRAEGLKYYTLDFGTKVKIKARNGRPFTISTEPKIFINWQFDRLCLMNMSHRLISIEEHNWFFDLRHRYAEKKLRFLAFNVWDGYEEYRTPKSFLKWIPLLESLEELVLFAYYEGRNEYLESGFSIMEFRDVDFVERTSLRLRAMRVMRTTKRVMMVVRAARMRTAGMTRKNCLR